MGHQIIVIEGDDSIDPDRLRLTATDRQNSLRLVYVSRDDDAAAVELDLGLDAELVRSIENSLRLAKLLGWWNGEIEAHARNFAAAVDCRQPNLAAAAAALRGIERAAARVRAEVEGLMRDGGAGGRAGNSEPPTPGAA